MAALQTYNAVIFVLKLIQSGETQNQIQKRALRAITNIDSNCIHMERSARRIILFLWLFTRRKPIVVLYEAHRDTNQPFDDFFNAGPLFIS